ncbi:MAG: Trk system potassium transporter TrkA [Alphaproteobacteria bacterium]|nr:MAG: Trk system potassium transporter TrkA [Alphaproteobacteria bacterium]TAF14910.1 MAG: Trk system potassium transporter TrkA [Alphaproteobacteria bacterium]TAF38781.1 MAG: Trk system potassium transporter TrkA [Alphaproteobacteria bacterium]TAF77188.1 MAG: Trk system potassium transporter TrkA [Alphaproteobacteria bacterium]
MDIIICGAGQVGRNIAQQLANEGNVVTVIDKDADLIADINNTLDVRALHGMASHPTMLEQAGAENCDMLIAVTSTDEVNMIACQIARSIFEIPSRIARIRQPDYLQPVWKDLYRNEHLSIDTIISPELEVAEAIIRRLHVPGALDAVPFGDGEAQMLTIKCEEGCPLSNLPIKLVQERLVKNQVALLGLVQQGKFRIPTKLQMLSEHDVVYVVTEQRTLDRTLALFGHHEKEARRLVILGGGNIGLHVAQKIEEQDAQVRATLIELNRDRAEYIAHKLKRTDVIHGSGFDKEILSECDIEVADTLVAVTNDDKVNILASLLAKKLGCRRAITLVNNSDYIPMVQDLDIDVVVNPRETTVSSILRHIRRGKINGVYSVMGGVAEIIEAELQQHSQLAGKVMGSLNLPKTMHLGAILRNNRLILPTEQDILHVHDDVIIVSMADSIKHLERYFSPADHYF